MSLRLCLIVAGGVGIFVSVAQAQTVTNPLVVPAFPTPPLVVPITPTPLDEKSQEILEAQKLRAFVVSLKHVKPSVMAHWLDPKNHKLPDSELNYPPFPLALNNLVLPKGINSLTALDEGNILVLVGTVQGIAELRQTILLLDRVQVNKPWPLSIIVNLPVTFDVSICWIDSVAPGEQDWKIAASTPRIARAGELESLDALKAQDRVSLQPLLSKTVAGGETFRLPFASSDLAEVPLFTPVIPNLSNGQKFNSLMPRINPDSDIDPGITLPHFPTTRPGNGEELGLMPLESSNGSSRVMVSGLGAPPTVLSLHDDDTFLLSGSATSRKLLSPSPRFDTFVLAVKVHVDQPPIVVIPAVPNP
ncbi:hypothetical protein IAD21_03288 [Abditibacteriota bacterium]|nr:hypothetical protein IAD21_03288 [Abditibacteriota bacterium]